MASLNDFKKQFEAIGESWRLVRRETGDLLLTALDELYEPEYQEMRRWIKENYRINYSEQEVCVRIASGEVEEEVADRLPASKVKSIPSERMPEMDREYDIFSPELGGPVKKEFRKMSRCELDANFSAHGLIPLDTAAEESPRLQSARATSFRVEKKQLILFVKQLNIEVKCTVSEKLLKALRRTARPDQRRVSKSATRKKRSVSSRTKATVT